jgi:hypothetical protein
MTTAAPIAPPVVDPEVTGIPGKTPETVDPGDPANQKTNTVDPIEKEISEKYGDDWGKLSDKIKQQVLSAERKTRDADKRYQQIARIQKDYDLSQKQMGRLAELLKTNPRSILENPALGLDIHKLAEEILWEKIQREKMDPKDRELAELKARIAERDKSDEKSKAEREEQEMDAKVEAAKAKYRDMIGKAVEESKLPNTKKVVAQMAYYIKLYNQSGKDIDMKAIAAQVKKDHMEWQSQFLESAPDDELLSLVPKSVLDRIRKADLSDLRAKGLAPKPGPKAHTETRTVPKKKESMEEWRERMRAERSDH